MTPDCYDAEIAERMALAAGTLIPIAERFRMAVEIGAAFHGSPIDEVTTPQLPEEIK